MKEIQNRANTIKKPQNDNSASHQQANLRNQNGAAGSDPGQSSVVAAGSSSPEDNPDKDNLVMSNAIEDHEPLTYREAIGFFTTDIKYYHRLGLSINCPVSSQYSYSIWPPQS